MNQRLTVRGNSTLLTLPQARRMPPIADFPNIRSKSGEPAPSGYTKMKAGIERRGRMACDECQSERELCKTYASTIPKRNLTMTNPRKSTTKPLNPDIMPQAIMHPGCDCQVQERTLSSQSYEINAGPHSREQQVGGNLKGNVSNKEY